MNLCVRVHVCVFNNMCVLERATHRPTPTESWLVVDLNESTNVGVKTGGSLVGGPELCV